MKWTHRFDFLLYLAGWPPLLSYLCLQEQEQWLLQWRQVQLELVFLEDLLHLRPKFPQY
jgi:hypothetical protein